MHEPIKQHEIEAFQMQFGRILSRHFADHLDNSGGLRAETDTAAQALARFIRARRLSQGLSISELAEAANLTPAVVQSLERGLVLSTRIHDSWLRQLAYELNTEVSMIEILIDRKIAIPRTESVAMAVRRKVELAVQSQIAFFGSEIKWLTFTALSMLSIALVTIMASIPAWANLFGPAKGQNGWTSIDMLEFMRESQGLQISLTALALLWIFIRFEGYRHRAAFTLGRLGNTQAIRNLAWSTPLILLLISGFIGANYLVVQPLDHAVSAIFDSVTSNLGSSAVAISTSTPAPKPSGTTITSINNVAAEWASNNTDYYAADSQDFRVTAFNRGNILKDQTSNSSLTSLASFQTSTEESGTNLADLAKYRSVVGFSRSEFVTTEAESTLQDNTELIVNEKARNRWFNPLQHRWYGFIIGQIGLLCVMMCSMYRVINRRSQIEYAFRRKIPHKK